jgi:hypothetical protein
VRRSELVVKCGRQLLTSKKLSAEECKPPTLHLLMATRGDDHVAVIVANSWGGGCMVQCQCGWFTSRCVWRHWTYTT